MVMKKYLFTLSFVALFTNMALADIQTVEEQEQKTKLTIKPTASYVIKQAQAVDKLVTDLIAGYIQGVDSNPLLDSTHKADNFSQEMVDMHFRYPMFGSFAGFTTSKFGFTVVNNTYYQITDVSTLDGFVDYNVEQKICDSLTLTVGYQGEMLWYPNFEDGNYFGNEVNVHLKHKIIDRVYHTGSYRFLYKHYLERKIRLGTAQPGSPLRNDQRNTLQHEVGAFVTDITKLRVTNQFAWNDSNDEYFDFYDYFSYRVGAGVVQIITKKLTGIAGFYYQRKNYYERQCSDKQKEQRDNLYAVSGSLLYDLTKNISVFVSYAHTENHTNEPLERYTDNLYSFGAYYTF